MYSMYDKQYSNACARCAGTQADEGLCFFDRGLPVEDTFLSGFFLWKQVLGSKLINDEAIRLGMIIVVTKRYRSLRDYLSNCQIADFFRVKQGVSSW